MQDLSRLVFLGSVLAAAGVVPARLAAESPPTPEQVAFFEKSIRPVLVTARHRPEVAQRAQPPAVPDGPR
jgi:hypothetical protein